jgi:hypothetical protein
MDSMNDFLIRLINVQCQLNFRYIFVAIGDNTNEIDTVIVIYLTF